MNDAGLARGSDVAGMMKWWLRGFALGVEAGAGPGGVAVAPGLSGS